VGTVFGAVDLGGLIAQLNTWVPQIEMQLQAVMGTAMVAEGRVQQLSEGGAMELRNIVTAFRSELDYRTAARMASDEALKDELRAIVGQVHSKFLEVEAAMERLRATTTMPTATTPATVGGPPAAPAPPTSQVPDPWAAAAAALHRPGAGAGSPPGATPTAPTAHGGGGAYAGPAPPGIESRYRVVHKNWGGHKLLDLDVNPDGFIAWRERALGFLTTDRPDIRRLLLWAERQGGPISEVEEIRGARETMMMEDVDRVSYVVFEALKSIMTDALLGRARACGEGRGLELWRRLHSEWRGSAPQVVAAKARRFQDPPRCSDIKKLWEALPTWEQLGSEVVMAGYPVPDWVKAQALDKIIPMDLLNTIVGRPELSEFSAKMAWIKAQMEHSRGATLAHQVSGKGCKDMEVGAMMKVTGDDGASEAPSSDSVIWCLQSELGRRSAEGDWDAVNALSGALFALGKGKGKGKSKGSGRDYNKGVPKGGHGKGGGKNYDEYGGKGKGYDGGKGGRTFEGTCNYCGKYGHRKSECKALDAEMARKGKGKGKTAYGLSGEEEYEDKDGKEDPPETPKEDEWWVGAVCALSREDAFARVDPRRSAKSRSDKDLQPCPTKVHNMYAGLEQDDDEYEAVKGDQVNKMEVEPDACADVGDSTGRVPHTQAPRGTPARGEIGAWRPSLCGEPACRPPRVGAPPPRLGGFMGPQVKYEYKDGRSGAWRGTPPTAPSCGYLSGLRAESDWPGIRGDIETRATRRMRAAKAQGSDSGECLKNGGYNIGSYGMSVKIKGATTASARSGECLRTHGDGQDGDGQGGDGHVSVAFGASKLKSWDSGECLKNSGYKIKKCDSGECLKNRAYSYPAKHGGNDTGECLKTYILDYTAKRKSKDSGECTKTKGRGKDLDLLVSESGLDRFLGAVSKEHKDGKMKIVEAVVDSGAEESVAPPGCFPGPVVPSRMSRAGGKYRAANGARIPNLGQQKVPFVNEDGGRCGIVFQIAEVERPLISATQLAASGNSVIINSKGGKIVNDKSGKVMKLTRRGGVLVLRMRIPTEDGPGFPGPGR
jgi:hypothetical protein